MHVHSAAGRAHAHHLRGRHTVVLEWVDLDATTKDIGVVLAAGFAAEVVDEVVTRMAFLEKAGWAQRHTQTQRYVRPECSRLLGGEDNPRNVPNHLRAGVAVTVLQANGGPTKNHDLVRQVREVEVEAVFLEPELLLRHCLAALGSRETVPAAAAAWAQLPPVVAAPTSTHAKYEIPDTQQSKHQHTDCTKSSSEARMASLGHGTHERAVQTAHAATSRLPCSW